VIPKPLREELHLEAGDALEMESTGEQITLRPVRGTGPLTKEHGVWVFHAGQPLPASATDDVLKQVREEPTGRISARVNEGVFRSISSGGGVLRRSRSP